MEKKKIVMYNVPGVGLVRKEKVYHTRYVQDKKTGEMRGRKTVEGKGDGTGVVRVKKAFVLVTKENGNQVRREYEAGQVQGRF